MHRALLLLLILTASPAALGAVDQVLLRRDGQEKRIAGELLVTAEDGGLLLMAPDGVLWAVLPEELIEHKQDQEAFSPLTQEQFAKHLLSELPAGFETLSTAHYLICFNTSREYAAWCGALFE